MQKDKFPDLARSGARCPVDGKVRYVSRKAARQAARKFRGLNGTKQRAYRCGDFWHLTSQDTATWTYFRERDRGAAA